MEAPQTQGVEGGKGLRPEPGQVTSPRGLNKSQALRDPRKSSSLSLPMTPLFPQSPFQNGREGRLWGRGVRLGLGLEQCGSGVKRLPPPHSQALERYHALKEPTPFPIPRALKPPSFLSYSSPSQGRKRGTQTFQLRSGVGG